MEIKKLNLPQDYALPELKTKKPWTEAEFQEPKDTAVIVGKSQRSPKPSVPAATEAESAGPQKLKKWTILVYAASDNNLMKATEKNIDGLETVGSNNEAHIAVQFDYGKKKGVQRFYLEPSPADGKLTTPPMEKLGSQNMADPKILTDFISWGIKSFPSEHIMVIISDHGDGWKGAIDDNSHKSWMSTPDIAEALKTAQKETGKKIDILGFDACLMASTEAAYELKDAATYMVASQEIEEVKGWPFDKLFDENSLNRISRKLKGKLGLEPEALAKELVKSVELDPKSMYTLSAIDLSHMQKLARSIDALAKRITESQVAPAVIKQAMKKSQGFETMRDVYDLSQRLIQSPKINDAKLKAAAAQVKKDLKTAVIAEQHISKYPGAHGLHIEASTKEWHSQYGTEYLDTAFTQDTHWDEAISYLDEKYLG